MRMIQLSEALGYFVGDVLTISAAPFDTRVVRMQARRLAVEWPWWQADPDAENSWDGTVGFPRDPDAYGWCNTPWRVEPDVSELEPGQMCMVGIPPTQVRVTMVVKYEPPADFGFLPRPEYALGVVSMEDADDEEAGYTIYLGGNEPIELTR
jgi:hypothetical protein